jgi:hypothetical protein
MTAGASNRSNSWRLVWATGLSVGVLAACVGAGCNTSDHSTPPTAEAGPTQGMLEQVTTGGGGAATSSGGFGTLPQDAAEEPEPESDGAPPGDSSLDSGDGALPPSTCVDYVAPTCGLGKTCDLRYNSCCVNANLEARCVAKPEKCENSEDTVACTQACECPGSQVCCGYYYELMQVVGASCQAVAPGGLCQPNPQTNTQASAQLCGTQDECTQSTCINQTCVDGVTLSVCGLQSQEPFDCVANEAGP